MPSTIIGAANIGTGVTAVECQKQVRSWRLLRYLIELLVPSCNCTTFIEEKEANEQQNHINKYYYKPQPTFTSSNTITGTIFGYRRGKVRFCIQTHSKSTNPILLLELAVSTSILAREMQGGILRIALECTNLGVHGANFQSLISMPVWNMYCNGRRVGYAVKRRPSKADIDVLRLVDSVVVGAGVISGKELDHHDELMYLRANFKRVCGSSNCESYHLIDPDGNIGQELSIFFFRSG